MKKLLIKDARKNIPKGWMPEMRRCARVQPVSQCSSPGASGAPLMRHRHSQRRLFRADAVLPSELHQRRTWPIASSMTSGMHRGARLTATGVVALLQAWTTTRGRGWLPASVAAGAAEQRPVARGDRQYLLENERSIDATMQVLARVVQVASKTLRETIDQRGAIKRICHHAAVRQWAAQVSIPALTQ